MAPKTPRSLASPASATAWSNGSLGSTPCDFLPLGFAQMVVLDTDFQKKYYNFTFVRREFLGEVRCLVIDVEPREDAGTGRFLGSIWVEDQDYNVVRFNGTYSPRPRTSFYLHFDSWRLNLRPGMWLPAYIYSEESDLKYGVSKTVCTSGLRPVCGDTT